VPVRFAVVRFEKTIRVKATPAEMWTLVDELEVVAGCIPGIANYSPRGPREFDAVLTQNVGPVRARFELKTKLTDLDPNKSVTAVSEGRDKHMASSLQAEQRFELIPAGDETDVAISADIRVTGKLATFGSRIVLSKAEQVVAEAMANVSKVLEERRRSGD
jgi:carbon monoxide dehydrogenase subunit G